MPLEKIRQEIDKRLFRNNQRVSSWNLIIIICSLLVVCGIWQAQQSNINHLDEQLETFRQEVRNLNDLKERLSFEKDRLILEKDIANSKNAIFGSLFQLLSGLFLFATVYTAWHNYIATQDKQVSERFSKAIELLGNTNLGVRLGGLHALERLSQDSAKDYWVVMEVIAGFVRDRSLTREEKISLPPQTGSTPSKETEGSKTEGAKTTLPPTDLQTALLILDRCVEGDSDRKKLYLRGSDFSYMEFHESLSSIFRNMDLTEGNFQGAKLSRADLLHADFKAANLSAADLTNTNLAGTNLTGANLTDANLTSANLTGANLTGANLTRTNLTDANLTDAHLTGANFTRANLTDANLMSVNLTDANLTDANLTKIDSYKLYMPDSDLSRINFADSDLTYANFRDSDLSYANFTGANLSHVNLAGADLSLTDFSHANLVGADLSYANFTGADLSHASLTDANLIGANFASARGLSVPEVRLARNWKEAIYSDGFSNKLT